MAAVKRKKFRIPKVTFPPTMYRVMWIDANTDVDHDGPATDFSSGLVELPRVGYHTKTEKDEFGSMNIVISAEATVEGRKVNIRDNMTIPCIHVRDMKKLLTEEEWRAAQEGIKPKDDQQ